MKKLIYLIVIVLISSFALTGCSVLSDISQVPATEQSGIINLTKGTTGTITLYAGQDIPVGTVNVWNDANNLYVQYVVDDPWEMTCSHLYVGKTDPASFPSTPGQLPYSPSMEKSPSPSALYDDATMTYTIPLEEIYDYEFVGKGQGKGLNAMGSPGVEPCDEIFIAAHAEVIRPIYDCYELEPVWQIGDIEENNLVIPYDEFNFPTQVTGTQDFYVDTTPTINFPYFSGPPHYAPIINIHFNAEMVFWGRFLFSWSPGNTGSETIEVLLDGTKLGEVTRDGATSSPGLWWKNQERFIDSFDVPVTKAGDHVLTINVTKGNGLVWDWLKLEKQCIQEESAWAVDEDASHYFGKNWATYFNYTVQGEVFIETVTVFPYGADHCSSAILETGKNYRLDVSGTYTYWSAKLPDAGIADAKYSLRPEGSYNSGPGPQWISGDDLTGYEHYLELLVDENHQAWGTFNLAHAYSTEYTGDGNFVCFKIIDSGYSDNSGSLEVNIYRVCD